MKYLLATLLLSLTTFGSMASATEVRNVEDEITIELQSEQDLTDYYNYNFGIVPVRFRHMARFTITNNTQETINYVNSYILGNYYTVTHYCYKSLRPKESCMAEIAFWPMQRGFYSGVFSINFTKYKDLRINLQAQAM